MAKNQTYKREVIDGKEVMILIEEEIVDDPVIPPASSVELQEQLNELIKQAAVIQEQINMINDLPI